MNLRCLQAALAAVLAAGTAALAAPPEITDLAARFRNGQVFLTWNEPAVPENAVLRVYACHRPITPDTLPAAHLLAGDIDRGSARDWWRDRASFAKDAPSDPPVGFVIETGGPELDPRSGLHVHTVRTDTAGKCYFAVTCVTPDGTESAVRPGMNALADPVETAVEPRNIVWLADPAKAPKPGSANGKALILSLHGRGGGRPRDNSRDALNALYFADATQGWREGLPFKFQLHVYPDRIRIDPQERIWIGRAVTESPDARDHCPTAQSFYTGYHTNLRHTMDTAALTVDLYQERFLLGLIDWAQTVLGTDPARTYLTGTSMGGSGSVSMALHYPDRIAAVYAQVPIYSYTWKKGYKGAQPSARRLECMCGPVGKRPATLPDGRDLLDYLNAEKAVSRPAVDLPPIFALNGRKDRSIPWANNPPFYAAALEAKQALSVFWNDGDHNMMPTAPGDTRNWSADIFRYRLDQSFPVFTRNSDNKDFGNGDWDHGDITGWINRGLSWKLIEDTPKRYTILIAAKHPDITYPLTFDLTLRRRQAFKPAPGQPVIVTVTPAEVTPRTVTLDGNGLLTVPNIRITGPRHVTVTLSLDRD